MALSKKKTQGVIYLITNTITGKKYIGQTVDLKTRWREHRRSAGIENRALYRAMRKYGINVFSFEVIEECPVDLLNYREMDYILTLRSHVSQHGYNMTWGGTDCQGEKNPFFGKKHSDDTKAKWSEDRKGRTSWNKGISPSEETKAKISATLMGNTAWNKGVAATEEHKRKLSEAHIGIIQSVETVAKRAKSLTGQKRTPEQKERMSLAKVGKKNSESHKLAQSEVQKALWADPVYRENMLLSRRVKAALRKAA